MTTFEPAQSALLLVDLQNDFLHPDGAYGRAGLGNETMAALPERLAGVAGSMRAAGGWIVSTHFTLVAGRDGAPMIAAHLKRLRPFLDAGDFVPGAWGHDLVAALPRPDVRIEKVAYSAFYMSRLEWVLRRAGIGTLVIAGIVTPGGVASTVRDAQVRDFRCLVLSDGCAAFDAAAHETALADLGGIAEVTTCADLRARLAGGSP